MDAKSVGAGAPARVESARAQDAAWLAVVLLAAALSRLPALGQAYVDAWAWRQADVGSIARNFLLGGFDLLHPRIDWGGATEGYVGTEFPLVPWIAAIGYGVFGEHAWIGRAISAVAFLACLPSLHALVRDLYGRRAAAFALGFFAFSPLVVLASRSFTSDMTALALSIVALDLFRRTMQHAAPSHAAIAVAGVVAALAFLVKITYLIFGLPMLVMALARFGRGAWREPRLWAFAAIALVPPVLWYWHAHRVSLAYFPFHMFGEGMLATVDARTYARIVVRTFGVQRHPGLFSAVTPLVTALAFPGLFVHPRGRFPWTLHALLAASVVLLIAAGKGSRFEAYQLPFCVVGAGLAGAALDALCTRLHGLWGRGAANTVAACTLAAFGALALVLVRDMYEPWAQPYAKAGAAMDRIAPPGALIVAASNLEPMLFYFSRRKGWSFDDRPGSFDPASPEQAPAALARYRELGARYFVTTRYTPTFFANEPFRRWIATQGTVVADTADYLIVELAER